MIEVRDRAELPEEAPDLEIPDEIPLDEFRGKDREIFALGAMIGIMASGRWEQNHYGNLTNTPSNRGNLGLGEIAREAFRVADAMIAASQQQPRKCKG